MGVKYLLDVAIILLSTKLLGILTRKIQMPQVVGALLAGLILGPACLGWLHETDLIKSIAEIGVIVLMFSAGLETDIKELKKCGLAATIIALIGVIVPLLGGWWLTSFFNNTHDSMSTLQNIFIGVILTATSVSISVETLKELGKLSTRSGNAILGAALIDDVLGIIALTVISSFADPSVSIAMAGLKIIGFFIFCGIVAFLFIKFVIPWLNRYKKDLKRFPVLAFSFCLVMAYISEEFFGISDITGAFVAGLLLSNNRHRTYMQTQFDGISYMILSPVFFASVGLKVVIDDINSTLILFTVLLTVVAIISKIIGCGLGAKICKYTNLQAIKIGVGMVSRGEVALIVATKGATLGLMNDTFFGPIIIMVVATTILTPIMLKLIYKYQAAHQVEPQIESGLVDSFEERGYLENVTQAAALQHENMKEELEKAKKNKK